MKQLVTKALYALLLIQVSTLSLAIEVAEYIVTDYRGDVIAELDESGDVRRRFTFQPFGTLAASGPISSNSTIGFAGHSHDFDQDLIYMRARHYSPELNRFTEPDAYEFIEGNLLNLNRYNYGNNNPYSYGDPSGNVVETLFDIGMLAYDVYHGNWVDAGFDLAAIVIPGVPAGLSKIDDVSSITMKSGSNTVTSTASATKESINDIASGTGKADFIVSSKGTTMPTNKDFNLVDSNVKGGDWFQIHNKHADAKVDSSSPHSHFPQQHGKRRSREIKQTDGADLDRVDNELRNGTMRIRKSRGDKGGWL